MKSTLCAAIIGLSLTSCDSDSGRPVSPAVSPSTPSGAASPSTPPPASPGPTSATDDALEQRIANALREDTALSSVAPNITVDTNNGAVTLKGSVNSQQQRTDIESKVRGMAGVTQVTNNLEVSSASH